MSDAKSRSTLPAAEPRRARALTSSWMLLSIATVLLWGAWGIQSKMIVDRISPWMNQVLFSLGLVPLLLWVLFWKNLRTVPGSRNKGAVYGLATGILGGLGNIAFYVALSSGGKASVIVPIAGLAPLVTVVLALLILKESLNRAQIAGLVLALASIYLLSV